MRLPPLLSLSVLLFACSSDFSEDVQSPQDDTAGDSSIEGVDAGTAGSAGESTQGEAGQPGEPLALRPNSFHVVHIADTYSWDAIDALARSNSGPMITSQNKPEGLPYERWAKNISVLHFDSGAAMADTINALFSDPAGAPARIMIDEVRGASKQMVADCAARMRTNYPQWRGRWGAYLVTGEAIAYPNLQPAVDELLDAGAHIAAEMYAHQSRYCASGSTIAARDQWLGDYFHGSRGAFSQGRFHWLARRRQARGSDSQLTVLFGVTDAFLDGQGPAKFLDRMFYVFATRSGYRGTILEDNGGPGAWKWDAPFNSNTSRDQAFYESFEHYSVQGKTSSRLGPVNCN